MSFSEYFPVWNKLDQRQKDTLERRIVKKSVKKGTVLHEGAEDCLGLLVIRSGQIRVYMLSEEGREVTLYRLFEHDVCLFSASCMMRNIMFDPTIETEKDTEFWIIPPDVYVDLMTESAAVANYTNDLMASRFSEVMWLVEQIMWKSVDKRLAKFLVEESVLEDRDQLKITHEKIANHMGTAREVVTRILKYFQNEGMVALTRGTVELTDKDRLYQLCEC